MKRAIALMLLAAGCAGKGSLAPPATQPAPESAARRQPATIPQAIERGVAYLVQAQNADGSWGSGRETRGFEIYSMVPGSHDAFRIGTTALCVMALREAGEKQAHGRGVEYLIQHGQARRDSGDIIYNTWAHLFTLQALALEMPHDPDPRLKQTAEWHLDRLSRYETFEGGWGYYDFQVGTQTPAGGATSFSTAAALVALWDARRAGLSVPDKMIARALRVVDRTRLPNGVYLYGADYKYIPRLPANQPRGAVGRTQPCNYALLLWNHGKLGADEARRGLDLFAAEHAFLEMGRQRYFPHGTPHCSWYQTAGYYYYFDHYYAARLIDKLGDSDKRRYGPQLAQWILPHQEADGSWWDFAMWDYHKPYGTAFALMALGRCQP